DGWRKVDRAAQLRRGDQARVLDAEDLAVIIQKDDHDCISRRIGHVQDPVWFGTQLKIIPARVTGASRAESSEASAIGAIVPAGARPSRLNSVCACDNAPSAVSTPKTARLLPSEDAPRRVLAMAPLRSPPVTICGARFVT